MTEKPSRVDSPDFSKVIALCGEYLDAVEAGVNVDRLSRYDASVFEAALMAVYGPTVFRDFVNPRL